MKFLKNIYQSDNIARAWCWIKSNPDRIYKNYFRDLYAAFSIAEESNLISLSEKIKRGIYHPSAACKIFLPKASGILRPYSLLTIEDQIVYQAIVNIIAERLYPKIKHRYYQEVFGHLYAGKMSNWFYEKWQKGYSAFNKAAKQAYADGFTITAKFDLTACYDSIDHEVLKYFLRDLGINKELSDSFSQLLSVWTATRKGIFHGHGIPQGPISSGLIAEVVLRHFDDCSEAQRKQVKYFRYVDDIHLYAKNEHQLRIALVELDKTSKDIGLFPHQAKICIHEITDINEELKSISQPIEQSAHTKEPDQCKLLKQIVELTPKYRVKNPTRFKFLLAHAIPSSKLTSRLWKILDKSPDFYEAISGYLSKYKKFPASVAKQIINIIKHQQLYQAVPATFLKISREKLHLEKIPSAQKILKSLWKPKTLQADLLAELGRFLVSIGHLTNIQLKHILTNNKVWWEKTQLYFELSPRNTSSKILENLINFGLKSTQNDVAITAAFLTGKLDTKVTVKRKELNIYASNLLKEFGSISRNRTKECGIHISLKKLLHTTPNINWKIFFGKEYRRVERHIIESQGYAKTNATAWAQALDVFNDYLLFGLFSTDKTLGKYNLGATNIGAILNSPPVNLSAKYPQLLQYMKIVHEQRRASRLSHTRIGKTNKPTITIPFHFIQKSKNLLKKALYEINI